MPRLALSGAQARCELFIMTETEDYPGPTQNQPEKEGQEAPARTDEEMVKPPAKPEVESKEEKARRIKVAG